MINTENKAKLALNIAIFLLLTAIGTIMLFRSPYNASDLEIVPDSVEYAVGANRLATGQNYTISINNTALPPRYPLWFSSLILAPAYIILGPEIGNAIFPITLFGILGIITAFAIGRSIAGNWAGFITAMCLLLLPSFRYYSRHIMTDGPCTSIILLECLLYMKLRTSEKKSILTYTCAGILAALAGAFRPVCFAIILPFLIHMLRQKKIRILNASMLIIPILSVITGTLISNSIQFGGPLRNGYNFWCPVPYDYSNIVCSASYIIPNLQALLFSGAPFLAVATAVLLLGSRKQGTINPEAGLKYRSILEFTLLATGPIVLFHLFYFYPDERFFLPLLALLILPAGIVAGAPLARLPNRALILTMAIALTAVITIKHYSPDPTPSRRITADMINECTPDNALIISSIDPVYLEHLVCSSSMRAIYPLSRRVEYASKVISTDGVLKEYTPPKDWKDYRRKDFIAAGALNPCPIVIAEQPWIIEKELKDGVPVFLDTGHVVKADKGLLLALASQFKLTQYRETIFKLDLKESESQ